MHLVLLSAPYKVVQERLLARRGHFMSPSLLRSQFEALEQPHAACTFSTSIIDARASVDAIVEKVLAAISVAR